VPLQPFALLAPRNQLTLQIIPRQASLPTWLCSEDGLPRMAVWVLPLITLASSITSSAVRREWARRGVLIRMDIATTSSARPRRPDQDFWITATRIEANAVAVERSWSDWLFRRPVTKGKRLRNYCSSGDGSVRSAEGPPLTVPYTQAQCARLPVDQ
jgi:hypothetical protein